jgi:hypothetical protein
MTAGQGFALNIRCAHRRGQGANVNGHDLGSGKTDAVGHVSDFLALVSIVAMA